MREIKFTYTCVRSNGFVFSQVFSLDEIEDGRADFWKNINHTCSGEVHKRQFTGLKDRNGKEIYEGDIVKYTYYHYKKPIEVVTDVYWNYHGFYIRTNMTKLIDSRALMAVKRDGEVIGNIYENPNLITNG